MDMWRCAFKYIYLLDKFKAAFIIVTISSLFNVDVS